jgi:hypothetical protein
MKYSSHNKKEVVAKYTIHPIWRGIGFIMIILLPVMAWAAADETVNWLVAGGGKTLEQYIDPVANQAQGSPGTVEQFMRGPGGKIFFPKEAYYLPVIGPLAASISKVEYLGTIIILMLTYLLFFSGILSFVIAWLYRRLVPRYSPLDVAAPKVSGRRYKR